MLRNKEYDEICQQNEKTKFNNLIIVRKQVPIGARAPSVYATLTLEYLKEKCLSVSEVQSQKKKLNSKMF